VSGTNALHLYVYRGEAPAWPTNGRPRKRVAGGHFEAEVVLLRDGHALRLTSDNRTIAEFVAPAPPAPGADAAVNLTESPLGSYFSNDRLLYRGDHRTEQFRTDAAFTQALAAAERELAADGAEVLRDPKGGAGAPVVAVRVLSHEVEVRALYPDPKRRTLLRWTSVLGMKLKLRR
jgi:hypothetical protein